MKTLRLICLYISGESVLCLLRNLEIILDIPLFVSVWIEGGPISRNVGRTKWEKVFSTMTPMWWVAKKCDDDDNDENESIVFM